MNLQPTSYLSEILSGDKIPVGKRAYFQERLKNTFYQIIVQIFQKKEAAGEITRSGLAKRIGKRPEQITRLLGASGNMRLDTVSDLLLGLGYEADIKPVELREINRNFKQPEWLESNNKSEYHLYDDTLHMVSDGIFKVLPDNAFIEDESAD
jgi:DNA-binding phage protein